ncbi:Exportin 7, partial [Blyttiomyces sp. JEL0837]
RLKSLSWTLEATGNMLKKFLHSTEIPERDCHEFCRMLVRLKTVHHLKEILERPQYPEWIELAAAFTINSFDPTKQKWITNSVVYLITFWSKLAATFASPPRSQLYERLEEIIAQISNSFLNSRIKAIDSQDEESRAILDDEATLTSILELIGTTARLKYHDSGNYLKSALEVLSSQYKAIIGSSQTGHLANNIKERLQSIELKLSWCVYYAGACIKSRQNSESGDEFEKIDTDLSILILEIIELNSNWVRKVRQHQMENATPLEFAILYFLEHFRKTYISGTYDSRSGKELGKVYGIDDQGKMLEFIVQRLLDNLKNLYYCELLVSQSVKFLTDLTSGYSPLRALRKTETARLLLRCHTAEYLPFLDVPANRKLRLVYYNALGHILFTDEYTDGEAEEFLKPFAIRLEELLLLSTVEEFRQPNIRTALDCIFRDLRGVVSAMDQNNPKTVFLIFFDWFYPYMPLLLRALEANFESAIAFTILRFFAELVLNNCQRLQFDVASPNGLLLFLEASKVLKSYGQMALARQVEPGQAWDLKYKGYELCFKILSRTLAGKYVPFGVLSYYKDPALEETLQLIFQILLSIPMSDLMSYPKLTLVN